MHHYQGQHEYLRYWEGASRFKRFLTDSKCDVLADYLVQDQRSRAMDHMSLRSNSKVNASYCKYVMSYYEFIPAGDTEVFKPLAADPVPNKGIGYVKNNLLYSSRDKTKVYGHVGGLYFYHTEDVIEDVVTITFSEGLVRPWGGSSISLRGSWFMTPDGQADLDKQELGIVGGQGQFRGVTGFVKYEKVQKDPQTVFHVTCHIYVPDFVGRDHEVEINLNELLEADAKPNGFHGHGHDQGHGHGHNHGHGHDRRE
ncbi:hypothetical protein AXG93_2752s1000 [Marchantia polymorpha subsp. ruderalis]|uniref:Dirigent protein n=2 Tax=Marchantia polymorpha subsp. ruderalis TaxID=1480154 RepID=A0A176VW35_MARPO|nr:hypothetical protein AXG93_2752s1000 [Marchantia polymorpha subsp. ruderalis]